MSRDLHGAHLGLFRCLDTLGYGLVPLSVCFCLVR